MDEALLRSLHDLLLPDTAFSRDSAHKLAQMLRDISDNVERSVRVQSNGHLKEQDTQVSMEEPSMEIAARTMSGGQAETSGEHFMSQHPHHVVRLQHDTEQLSICACSHTR